jgi:hypothetical protein
MLEVICSIKFMGSSMDALLPMGLTEMKQIVVGGGGGGRGGGS